MIRTRVWKRFPTIALVIAALIVPAAIAANAGPAGFKADVKKDIKKLNKKVKKANKKAAKALDVAQTTAKAEGPQGDPGPAGADGQDGADLLGSLMGTGSVSANQTRWFVPSGGESTNVVDSRPQISPNRPIELSEFYAETVSAITNGSMIYTVRVDGANTAITCTINVGQSSCSSNATANVPPRSQMTLQIQNTSAAVNSPNFGWSMTVR